MANLLQWAPDRTEGVFWFVVDHVATRRVEDPQTWYDLTPEQRTVLVLGVWRRSVQTGGFEQYFRYDTADTATEALDAARLLPPGYRTVLADAVRLFGRTALRSSTAENPPRPAGPGPAEAVTRPYAGRCGEPRRTGLGWR